jgi:hypothetical protein
MPETAANTGGGIVKTGVRLPDTDNRPVNIREWVEFDT